MEDYEQYIELMERYYEAKMYEELVKQAEKEEERKKLHLGGE